jgi:aromatic-L-amino-acid decarboxylase
MNPDEFRHHGHQLVDWMADYFRDVGAFPVTPNVEPGDTLRHIAAEPPEQGESFSLVIQDFREVILPGMTHWNHPGWFAYFPANNSAESVLAEMITATMGAQCMSWATSPAATELEQSMMEWLRQMLGLPPAFVGVIQDTASTATLVALLSARERAGNRHDLTVYASAEAHSSVEKGVRLAGYGLGHLRTIEVDSNYAMRAEQLERAIASDRREGLSPACVVATVGTTSSTAVDPLPQIGEICLREGIWLHVDAAYAGAAAILPELRHLFSGVERADSFVFNPHKWLLVNFDCSAYFVRDRETLLRTFGVAPEYLRTQQDQQVVNYRDWGIQLGRRFRALKLWFVIRSYGVNGLQSLLRKHIALAREFAGWIQASPDFELVAPVHFGLVCFRYHPDAAAGSELDELNRRLLARVNSTRRVHLTHTQLGGRYVIRMAIGQRETEREHVADAWRLIREAASPALGRELTGESG